MTAERIFRLDVTLERDPSVEAWFAAHPGELGALARRWFETLRGLGDDVREALHDGQPTACVGEAAFAYVDAYTAHVNVGFFHGAALDDPAGLLEGGGKSMRHVKLGPGRDVDEAALAALVRTAYEDLRRRLGPDSGG